QAVLDNDGTALGVVALSLSGDELEAIMGVRNGLGRTGETFLVGPDRGMRTSSYFSGQNTVLRELPDSEHLRRMLRGETDAIAGTDYRGQPVYVAFTPLEFGDLGWGVVAKIDQSEALQPT